MNLTPIFPKLLSCRLIPNADPALALALGCDPKEHCSVGLVTCDQDDSLYAALDHATKFAKVDVVYARSFYAGSAHSSGPLSGEILGILAGANPDEVAEGLRALRHALANEICFYTLGDAEPIRPAFFPHVIPSLGRYLAKESGLAPGDPMAYLIAPPTEAVVGLDRALKAARVKMVRFFGPPTETNYGGAYLTGELPEVEAAARAFAEAVVEVASYPLEGSQKSLFERR